MKEEEKDIVIRQRLLSEKEHYQELADYIQESGFRKILLVCGKSIEKLEISIFFAELEKMGKIKIIRFSEFVPNPSYESVVKGVELFNTQKCDAIFAIGGGSAIDVAKCIKLFAFMDQNMNFLRQKIVPNKIPLFAMPTTAGTGSEATKFAVIYYKGEKQSVSDDSCIPDTILLDANTLYTLPLYQKKSAMLDAVCHAIESFWSKNATEESKKYSAEALKLILNYKDKYLGNDEFAASLMLKAANLAGKAINITQTTAGHAMCYKLTSLYGLAHGHAAALCVYVLWPYMIYNLERCIDPRGKKYLESTFQELAEIFGSDDVPEAVRCFQNFYKELGLYRPMINRESEYSILKDSVNPVRLKNNPVRLDVKTIDRLYHQILEGEI